jgi:predicted lipoprotein with Yx(FWY)xxD motif
VLTALALAGWGVRAAGTPQSNTASTNSSVPLAAPTNAPAPDNSAGADAAANNGGANNGGADQNTAQPPAQNNGNAAPAVGSVTTKLVAKAIPRMGESVVDDQGFVLYRFDKDTPKPPASNCSGKCEKVWPPVTVQGGQLPQLEGIDQTLVGTIQRADGSTQVTLAGWPLYRYIGDKAPGKWTGQGVGGTWFVSAPNGKKNLTCVPTGTPKAVEPPADSNAGGNGGGNSGGGGGY